MARKNDTPQKAALREFMSNYLKQNLEIYFFEGIEFESPSRYS